MYNEDTTRIPADKKELWEVLWQQFEYVRHVLWDLDVETKEEALANGNDPAFRHGMGISVIATRANSSISAIITWRWAETSCLTFINHWTRRS